MVLKRKMFWLPGWEIPVKKKDIPYHPISLYHFINVSFFSCFCFYFCWAVFISILPNFPSISCITHTHIHFGGGNGNVYVLTFVKGDSLVSVQYRCMCASLLLFFFFHINHKCTHTKREREIYIVTYIYSKDDNLLNHTFNAECYQLILKLA